MPRGPWSDTCHSQPRSPPPQPYLQGGMTVNLGAVVFCCLPWRQAYQDLA